MTEYLPLPQRLLATIQAHPTPRAQLYRTPSGWQPISSQEFLRRVACLSAALERLGVALGDRVALYALNSPEWHTADFAITGLGAVVVPIYFRESPERMLFILKDSGAKILFVAGADQARQVGALHDRLSGIEHIILAPVGATPAAAAAVPTSDDGSLRYECLIAAQGDLETARYGQHAAAVRPEHLATIIYTSGTTGEPKGVMLTHRNISSNATDACPKMDFIPGEIGLSFLPLAHIYERTVDYMYLFEGMTIAYVERMEDVPQALVEVHPTVAAAVPRFFEKIYANTMERGMNERGFKRAVFMWAMHTAERAVPWKARGHSPSPLVWCAWQLANLLVYSKIRRGLGGRIRSFVSGGGPLSNELAGIFWALGLPVYQGYGLTETAPIVSTNWPIQYKNGTSGKPIPNVEVRTAADGEIEVRGPTVMAGYYHRPEATREAITPDGWFRTGDIGYIDPDGYLIVTDRKKDLLKTAGGKFVAPQPIENRLKTSPFIQNAVVVGDGRKFISALVVPNLVRVEAEARRAGIPFRDSAELLANPWTHGRIEKEITQLTAELAQYEKIKRFALLPEDFTFAKGEITYTLKLRRRIIEERYRGEIEQLYADLAEPRPIL